MSKNHAWPQWIHKLAIKDGAPAIVESKHVASEADWDALHASDEAWQQTPFDEDVPVLALPDDPAPQPGDPEPEPVKKARKPRQPRAPKVAE